MSPEKHISNKTKNRENRKRFIKKGIVASALTTLALAGLPDETGATKQPEIPILDKAVLITPHKMVNTQKDSINHQTSTKPKISEEAQLAQKILDNEKIAFWENEGVDTRTVIEDLAQDKPAELTCENLAGRTTEVDKGILQFVLKVANDGDYIMLNAITDKCHSDGSNHYEGRAVDLDCSTTASFDELEAVAERYDGTNNGEYCGPSSHYHFDFK